MAQQNQNAQDTPLWETDELEKEKWATALLAFVNEPGAQGRTRKGAIALLQEMLQEVNPLEVAWEKTTLFEDLTNNAPRDGDFSEIYNLDFRSGNSGPRHNFTNGYTHFELFVSYNYRYQNGSASTGIGTPKSLGIFPISELLDATQTNPFEISLGLDSSSTGSSRYTNVQGLALAKENDTSFRMGGNAGGSTYSSAQAFLHRIVGWKQTLRPRDIST